ncbi:phospholipase A2 [Fopius arisanus]|uniref:Phospholipase A2 n=1 Tax=Fopius arisanus TaxID=64838 RepID=A0A0C9R8Q7_9HYME|nr:PREDICTED: phospholipase A2 [Fopius arisanus]
MGFMDFLHVILFAMCWITLAESLLPRNNYKGLKGVTPHSEITAAKLRRVVYYHDQAVAIIDINPQKEIENCHIIEVYEPEEAKELLMNLSEIARPTQVLFSEMTGLMYRCQLLDSIQANNSEKEEAKSALDHANSFGNSAYNLLSGILPGTKWCGTGDIAEHYHDLGEDSDIDSCCRTHDLCPVKIRAHRTRYNITNLSLYSKSHCDCDNAFYNCLKSIGTPKANIMGKIYFNIIKVGCIEDFPKSANMNVPSTKQMRRFTTTKLYF